MGSGEVLTTAPELRSELQSEDTDETMMTGGARPKRGRWRRAKSRRKLEKAAKNSGQKTVPEEAMQRDQPDTLLLSALKYWEVERDLIEERLANIRSATAAS
jgi:hypothetical protein